MTALRSKGIVPRSGGGGPELDEPAVFPWMPAASVYLGRKKLWGDRRRIGIMVGGCNRWMFPDDPSR